MSYSNRALAPAAPEEDSSDNAGMREALGDLTILPAPANVDDLVARLDEEGVPYGSGPLATIISDARVPDLEPTVLTVWEDNEMNDDAFFSSIPMANSNHPRRARPLAPRVLGLLFGGGLTIGTLLICWNALVSADLLADRPTAPVPGLSDVAKPASLPPAAPEEPGTAWAELEPSPAEEPGQPAEALAVAPTALPQPEPSPAPVAVTESPESPGDAALVQFADVIADSAPVTLPEPVAMPTPPSVSSAQAPAPLEAADRDASGPTARPEAASLPEANGDAASAEPPAPAASPVSETDVAASAPAAPPEAAPQATSQPVAAAAEPSAPAGEMAADAAIAETGATESLPAPTTPEPEFAASVERSAVASQQDLPTSRHASTAPQRASAAAKPRAGARPSLRVPFVGAWATSTEACTAQGQQEGHLVTHINARRARAGDTSCTFRKIRRNGNAWDVAAMCSDGEARWTSDVQLSASRNGLTWTSQKGTTNYVRCRRG